MNAACVGLRLTVACLTLGCTQSHERTSLRRAAGVSSNVSAISSGMVPEDTTVLVDFLHAKHAKLDTLLGIQGNFQVLVISRLADTLLVTVIHDSAGMRQIGSTIAMNGLPYPRVQLVKIGPDAILRILTYDDLVENIVGTAVDSVGPGGMRREFTDPTNVCKAADFIEDSGAYRLHTYVDSPFDGDCLNQCAEELRSIMGAEPAELVVLQRAHGTWRQTIAESDTSVGRRYRVATTAIRNGTAPECAADSTRILADLAKWQSMLKHRS